MGFEELLGVNPWTAFFTLANTIALFLVMKKFLWAPVLKLVEDRQNEIDGLYADAAAQKTQAEAMRNQYQQKFAEASNEAERLVKEATARGQKREEEIIQAARTEADAIRAKASADIAREKKKAINDAKDEISVIALAIAGKVVGRELNVADQSQLVDQFIDELGENA